MLSPGMVKACEWSDLQAQIDALLATLADLQQQLADMGGGTGTVITGCTITSFDRNLMVGATGDDVKCLQIVLNSDTATKLGDSGAGSPGNETSYFGPITKAAAIKFQEKYASEVLASWGLTQGTGYIGSTSRAKLNTLLTSGAGDGDDGDTPVTPVEGSKLNVTLAADTPVSISIADNANGNFAKVIFTAGDEDVKISKIYVTRSGLSTNSDLENIKFYDMEGVFLGSVGSLNTDNRAMLTFTPALTIESGTSEAYYIRGGIVDATTAGKTASLGINAKSDIISDAGEVTGSFPITGNPMSVVTLTIGSAAFAEDGTTVDSTPDVGDTGVIINQFKITAGSTEKITLESLTIMESGTASLDDIENLELYSTTDGETLDTVLNWSADGKITFTGLDLEIGKGETHRFKIKADILDGPGLTVNADMVDGSDVLANVKGSTYGFYITPSATGSWDGKASNNQTINTGALTVTKSTATPATGNIAPGDDITIAVWDFIAAGEEVRISALTITMATGTMTASQVTNVKVYDADGTVVAGPLDLASAGTVAFTDVFIVPVGTYEYTVKAKIADDVSTSDTLLAGIRTPANKITAKGMTSNESITPTPASNVDGNTLTVAAGHLAVTTLGQPVARTIAKGISEFIFMTATLDASISGEDVLVTVIVIEDTTDGVTSTISELDNMAIWADLTSEDSTRGDVFETRITDFENPTTDSTTTADQTQSFTLTETLTVSAGGWKKIALVADLSADALNGGAHTVSVDTTSGDVTATGATTGSSITVVPIGAGQAMRTDTGGTLTVTIDSSSPTEHLMADETISTVGIWKLAANNVEDLDLDHMKITDAGQGDTVDLFYWYASERTDGGSISDPIATTFGGVSSTAYFADGTVTIPANDNVLITVKAKTNNIDGTAVTNADDIKLSMEASGDVDTTGLASGSAVDSTDTSVAAASTTIFESYPIVAVNSASPSGTLVPDANMLLAILDITAAGDKDVTFDGNAGTDGGSEDNEFYFQVSNLDGGSTTTVTMTIKDGDGNQVASSTTAAPLNVKTQFTVKDFVIPAGDTKQLYFYINSSTYTTTGDTLQLWLDDGGTGLDWSIDYDDGAYDEVDLIFKSDIYAGAFLK